MSRRSELEARLGPWVLLGTDVDLDVFTAKEWAHLLEQADRQAAENQKWFRIGIARAINEIKSKDADGAPLWPSREALIQHLQSIHAPH